MFRHVVYQAAVLTVVVDRLHVDATPRKPVITVRDRKRDRPDACSWRTCQFGRNPLPQICVSHLAAVFARPPR